MASMVARNRAFIVGGHITPFIGAKHPDFIWKKHPDFGKKTNPDLEWYIDEAVNGALKNANVPAEKVDKCWIGNFCGELFNNQGHLGAALVGANPGLNHKPSMRVEGACASGGLAFACALDSIRGGSANVTLVAGVEVQTTVSARAGGDYLARASHYKRQRELDDFTFPALFAKRIKECYARKGWTPNDLALCSAKAYGNANLNPNAHMQAVKMTVEMASEASDKNPAFLSNEELKPYLKISDCSQVSDGGAALILVSEEGLRELGIAESACVEVSGFCTATGNLYEDGDLTQLPTTAAAAKKAFAEAGISPTDGKIGVVEVHDCFSVTELLMMEALGFGDGAELIRSGAMDINGRLPCNTGGGLIGFGHPTGATGVKQLLEVMRQLKGQAGAYQVPKTPEYGLAANMGGDDKTACVTILKNCA